MKFYQTDPDGYFASRVTAQEDPLETIRQNKPIYLIPFGAVEFPPPEIPEGMEARWTGQAWTLVESRLEAARKAVQKAAEGRELVNGQWTEPRPSRYHTLSGSTWAITPENQALLNAELQAEADRQARLAVIRRVSTQFEEARAKYLTAVQTINAATTLAAIKPAMLDAFNALAQASSLMRDVVATLAKQTAAVDQE